MIIDIYNRDPDENETTAFPRRRPRTGTRSFAGYDTFRSKSKTKSYFFLIKRHFPFRIVRIPSEMCL